MNASPICFMGNMVPMNHDIKSVFDKDAVHRNRFPGVIRWNESIRGADQFTVLIVILTIPPAVAGIIRVRLNNIAGIAGFRKKKDLFMA